MDEIDFGVNIPENNTAKPVIYDYDDKVIKQWKKLFFDLYKNRKTKDIEIDCQNDQAFWKAISKLGDVSKYIDSIRKFINEKWFFGFLPRDVSQNFLSQEEIGTWLIRASETKPFGFVLEYRSDEKSITAMLVRSHPNGFILDQEHHASEMSFETIPEVIESWGGERLKKPFTSEIPKMPGFYGQFNGEEAQKFLTGAAVGTYIIRFSSQPGCYAISYIDTARNNTKSMIQSKKQSGLIKYWIDGTQEKFDSLPSLIKGNVKSFSTPYKL